MDNNFNNDKPIYLQLMDKFRELIIKGDYQLGSRLPSVREYALYFNVNPNTVQKALSELEKEKIIITDSTNGRYVTSDKELIENIKKDLIKCKIKEFITNMENIGISFEEIENYLKEIGDMK